MYAVSVCVYSSARSGAAGVVRVSVVRLLDNDEQTVSYMTGRKGVNSGLP
jgi:hypothetical protein